MKGTSIHWGGVSNYKTYSAYQSTTGEDAESPNANPMFVNLGATPPDLDIASSSPAINAGSTSLPCSVGWCNSNSPESIYGAADFLGNPRTSGATIDIGAYEATGIANSLTATLTSGVYRMRSGESTTLTATISADPGDGGVPSGTVNFMLGSNVLGTGTLLPTGATSSAASMPLNASQLGAGANTLTAVYSGNSVYGSSTSASITVRLQSIEHDVVHINNKGNPETQ